MTRKKNDLRLKLHSFEFFKTVPKLYLTAFLFSLLAVGATTVSAQSDDFPEFRPTPKLEISKDERKALEAEKDQKKFTRLAIDLMEARIKRAETLITESAENEMLAELGGFHGLMNYALDFLMRNNTRNGKSLDSFKRFEIALRAFTPRIEAIRRESPERFDSYLVKLLKEVRETRAKAVEPFFSDSVLPEN